MHPRRQKLQGPNVLASLIYLDRRDSTQRCHDQIEVGGQALWVVLGVKGYEENGTADTGRNDLLRENRQADSGRRAKWREGGKDLWLALTAGNVARRLHGTNMSTFMCDVK